MHQGNTRNAIVTVVLTVAPYIGEPANLTTEEVMTKTREQGSASRYFYESRRLNYGSIKLVPVAADYYPYDQERYKDMWHIPGRQYMSTEALVILATKRGITVTMSEYVGVNTQTTRLN